MPLDHLADFLQFANLLFAHRSLTILELVGCAFRSIIYSRSVPRSLYHRFTSPALVRHSSDLRGMRRVLRRGVEEINGWSERPET
ncbi:hypothetical protein P692DRAFT_20132287 [Suillus brevipes Sb2]|nr:hypothetical protein P692DRAFT_20132287 [Suillus brevipes Sb2]